LRPRMSSGQPKEKEGWFAKLKEMFAAKKKTAQARVKHIDLDEVLKYKTFRMVVFLDARLGLLNISLQILIVMYIVCFAIIFNKGYIEQEQSFGQIEMTVLGKTYFKQDDEHLVVDALDMVDPPLEQGALFIASRIENTKQTRDICGNSNHECTEDSDCDKNPPVYTGTCLDGLCQEMGWCPPMDTASEDTQVWDFEHPENVTLWIKAAIAFPKLAPNHIFTTMTDDKPVYESENPDFGNAYYLSEILEAANVPLIASKANGAMINVLMEWECEVDTGEGCASPNLRANRLDVGLSQGFHFADAVYKPDSDGHPTADVRFMSKQVGYRLIVSCKGTGRKVSLAAIVLQVSSGLALLGAAKGATDFLMLVVLPQKDFYRKYKEEETPNFSEMREMIKESEEQTVQFRGSRVSRYAVAGEF